MRYDRFTPAAAILALTLAACGGGGPVLPPMKGIPPAQQPPRSAGWWRNEPPAPLVKPPADTAAPSNSVVVLPGDTVHSIARRYRVENRALIDQNGLEPPFALVPGQVLVLPAKQFHTVVQGETLYGLSRHYRTDVYSLARINNLAAPYGIYSGQVLRLPGPSTATEQPAIKTAQPGPLSGNAVVTAPLPPPSTVSPPQPDPSPSEAERSASSDPAPMPAGIPSQTGGDRTAAIAVPPAAGSGARFAWPVRGRLLSGFGPKAGGQHNDGINIDVPLGTEVRSADAGIVIYAGNELKGYGNLLLIRHAEGYVTAYAHNERLLVKRGAHVRRGDVIAHAGSTGGVDRPQVHFEIRRGREAIDPLRLLDRGEQVSAAADRAGRPDPG